jgi:hypothetical protein
MVGVVGCIDRSVMSEKNHNIIIETPNRVEESILNEDEFPRKKKRKYSEITIPQPQKAGFFSSILDYIFKV